MVSISRVFKAGVGLLVGGFLLSIVSQSLGAGLGQLGMAVIGGAVLLTVARIVRLGIAAAGSESAAAIQERQPSPRETGRGQSDRRQRSAGDAEQHASGSVIREQPDLDVSTIDDYRR